MFKFTVYMALEMKTITLWYFFFCMFRGLPFAPTVSVCVSSTFVSRVLRAPL